MNTDELEYIWVPDRDWILLGDFTHAQCRSGARKRCPNRAVAALKRASSRAYCGYIWWNYCGDHLYGRRIENGRVEVHAWKGSPYAKQQEASHE